MNNKANIYKNVVNHSIIYGAADILRRFVGFFMLPIYTHYLTPEDYGVIQLLMVAISVMDVFLGMRLGQAIFRYYALAKEEREKHSVMSTAFIMTCLATSLAFLILAFNSEIASRVMLGSIKYTDLIKVYSVIILTQAMEDYGLIYLRIHKRPVLFFFVSIFKLILQVGLNVYLIVFKDYGVAGVIYSAVISSMVMAVFSAVYVFYYSGFNFSGKLAKRLVIFSYPLWLSAVAYLYTGSIDKYFLRLFDSLDAVGLYALAGKFAMLIMVVVWAPFSSVWQPLRYEVYELAEPNVVYRKIFMMLMVALSLVGLGLSLFSVDVIRLMAAKSFWPAASVVPILVLASIASVLAFFNNFGILLKEKTSIIAKGTYINVVVMTISFIALIKLFGMPGAALAALVGAMFNFLWIAHGSKKLYDMELPWSRAFYMTVTWLLCFSLSYLLPESLFISIAAKVCIVCLFIFLMFLLPLLEKDEKEQIFQLLRGAKGKMLAIIGH